MSRRLLLLSNSKNHGQGFLEHATGPINRFLGDSVKSVLFVPYAGVSLSFTQYTSIVRERFEELGYTLESVHEASDRKRAVANADAIAVGGGNTFHLLHHLYETGLIDTVRERVEMGMPYVGWSAGSNVACPTIKTTNDMPIIAPPTLDALGLVPFQINPHYLDSHPSEHQGETREQRIVEFIEINPDMFVAGLREGSMLRVEDSSVELLGDKPMRLFKSNVEPTEYRPGDSLDFLLG
jgi:dipeptidase E